MTNALSCFISDECGFLRPHDRNEVLLHPYPFSHAEAAISVDKGKHKIYDLADKDQPFADTHALLSFPEINAVPGLLCNFDWPIFICYFMPYFIGL